MDVYLTDVADVVSKYIGETEKNLVRVFDGVECKGSVLLFDEADGLFGRRVKGDSAGGRNAADSRLPS